MLFWLIVAAAIAVTWGLEHVRLAKQLEKAKERDAKRGLIRDGMWIGIRMLRARRADDLRYIDNAELLQKYQAWDDNGPEYDDALYQVCLSEMLRRGMRQELCQEYDRQRGDGSPREGTTGLGVHPQGSMLLPFLTAVRRADGKPDPVRIRLKFEPDGTASDAPRIVPILENVDVERQEIYLRTTGSHGTRLNGSWQLRLLDKTGRCMPLADKVQATGGFAGFRTLDFGWKDECDRPLDLRSYVEQPPPGKYQLQAVFCTVDIATDPELTGLIVQRSEPVDIIVTKSGPAGAAVIPVLALLYGALLTTAAVLLIGRWRNSGRAQLTLVNWRDAAAWVVLIALTLAWHHDIRRLSQEVHRLQWDEDAPWTWRLAK